MKKIAIILLSILIAGLFVACNQDITVDAQTYANMEVGTFVLNGQNYATLQAAIDALSSKAVGDNDGVIYLTRDFSGPGAVIEGKNVKIDFGANKYTFTNVTATQGSTSGTFGLKIKGGSSVTLAGTKSMDLFDSTTGLTMVYVEGAGTSLAVEQAPQMSVADDQFVFWAADGATLTIGGETQVAGGVAATGKESSVKTIDSAKLETSTLKAEGAAVVFNSLETPTVKSLQASDEASLIVAGAAPEVTKNDSAADASYTVSNTTDTAISIPDAKGVDINIPQNYEVVVDGDTQTQDKIDGVASIKADRYETLAKAVAGAKDGDTILLLKDIDLSESESAISISKKLTLNLNGQSIKCVNRGDINVTADGDLTLVDTAVESKGSIFSSADYNKTAGYTSGVIAVAGKFTMESGAIYAVRENAGDNGQYGIYYTGDAEVIINGGTIEAGWYAISGNGTNTGKPVVTINGGKLISTVDYAIYQPDDARITISGEAVVDGAAGAVCSNRGSLIINGGHFATSGTGDTGAWADGTGNLENVAIYLNAEYGDVSASIIDGTFTSSGSPIIKIGTAHEVTLSVTGGTYSADVSKFVDKGYKCIAQGTNPEIWKVEPVEPVAKVGEIEYETLVDAIKETKEGTITLLKNYSGEGIFVAAKDNKNITIDLGGFTYTCTGPAVGSTGTETQAWHLEKGNKITIKNGKLSSTDVNVSDVKMLIQNYCDLTLTDVELDGTNLGKGSYTLSNNSGVIAIDGATSIYAYQPDSGVKKPAEKGVAFDVCSGWGGYTSVSVTVNTTGTIDGIIELSDWGTETETDTEKVELIVENGVFNSSVRVPEGKGSDKIKVSIKGGEFYVSDSYTLEAVAKYSTGVNIHLLEDIESDKFIGINGARTVNLDLGKNELNLKEGWYVLNGHLSLENGTVTGNMPLSVYGSNDSAKTTGYSELTLKSDATIKDASWAICLFPLGKVEGYGALINVYGAIESKTDESTGIFVSGNLGDSGNDEDVAAMTSSNIINITGNINVEDQAIAMNGAATVKISGEAIITGSEAVGVKRGTLNVSGGTLTSTGAYVDPVSANNNGTEASGAVISITSTYNYSGQIDVAIESGSLVTTNGCGIYVGHSKKDETPNPYTKGISLTISDDVTISRTKYSEGTKMVFVAEKLDGDSNSYPDASMNKDWNDEFANFK